MTNKFMFLPILMMRVKIRKWFKRYLSESEHIYVDKTFCEVAKCPKNYLAHVLSRYGFNVKRKETYE